MPVVYLYRTGLLDFPTHKKNGRIGAENPKGGDRFGKAFSVGFDRWSHQVWQTGGGCLQNLFRIAEEKHAKIRVGAADDGIAYQGITEHLPFQLVFKEEHQAEDFETAVKRVPLECRKRKRVELPTGDVAVFPDITVEVHSIQRTDWQGDLVCIVEDHYEKIWVNAEPSPEYDMDGSDVSLDTETRLRMLEREDSPNFFRQNPLRCLIVRQADIGNPNNIVFMSRLLYQHLNVINSTEGIPQFYFRYVVHCEQHQQGLLNNKPIPMFETTLDIVFKDEDAKNHLTAYFKNPTDVNQTTIRGVAYFIFPNLFSLTTLLRPRPKKPLPDGLLMIVC